MLPSVSRIQTKITLIVNNFRLGLEQIGWKQARSQGMGNGGNAPQFQKLYQQFSVY